MPRDRRSYSRSPGRRDGGGRDSRSRSRSRSVDRYDRRRDDYNRRDRERDRRDNSYDRDRNRDDEQDQCRLHIADLTKNVSQYELEKAFSKFGDLKEVWMAKNPPCFAFVVYKNKDDATVALKEMDQRTVGSCRIRVTMARPRTKGNRSRRGFDPNMRCYTCGDRGHFARDCRGGGRDSYRRRRSYSRDRYNGRGRNSRSRSRSRRSYSRSRSPRRDYRSSQNMNGSVDM